MKWFHLHRRKDTHIGIMLILKVEEGPCRRVDHMSTGRKEQRVQRTVWRPP